MFVMEFQINDVERHRSTHKCLRTKCSWGPKIVKGVEISKTKMFYIFLRYMHSAAFIPILCANFQVPKWQDLMPLVDKSVFYEPWALKNLF